MKAIMLMFDSLSRRMLSTYNNEDIDTPNFDRLAKKAAVFDNFYAGSLPCIPARRDLHTGRYNFLHRSWGPLEPFDVSAPQLLKENGIYTHLVSDHMHYWDDGGSTYHKRYSSWQCNRGQAADSWVGKVEKPEIPEHVPTMREFTHKDWWNNYWKNRSEIYEKDLFPQLETFNGGLQFLEDNKTKDDWFLQIETFDPHEPFDMPEEFAKMYDSGYAGDFFNSPSYGVVMEDEDVVEHGRALYKGLITMCDRSIGKVLDFMDENNMWEDTMVILNCDHGLLVGEKDWWAKSVMPCYNEISNIPFFIYDPRGTKPGHRKSLAQTIDIPATLLDFFGVEKPKEMQGKSLRPIIENDTPVRKYGIFGYWGSFINITDGTHTYMRASQTLANKPCNEYTLMPTSRNGFFKTKRLEECTLEKPFDFTKGCPTMKVTGESKLGAPIFCNSFQFDNFLWDLEQDPMQENPIVDYELEATMINEMIREMKDNDAPSEQYVRVGLDPTKTYTAEDVKALNESRAQLVNHILEGIEWEEDALTLFVGLGGLMDDEKIQIAKQYFKDLCKQSNKDKITAEDVKDYIKKTFVKDPHVAKYYISKLSRVR